MQIIPAQSNVSYVQWKASASHPVEVASAMLFLLMYPLGRAAQQPANASGGSVYTRPYMHFGILVSLFIFHAILVCLHSVLYVCVYVCMAVLGLRVCARAFSGYGKRGPLFIAVRGPLTIAASLVAEHRLQTRRLSNCGSRAQPLRGTWDPPRPGLEPASPALAGRPPTTAPPGKPPFRHSLSHSRCTKLQHDRMSY